MKSIYVWVIRKKADKKYLFLGGPWDYFARRCSINNPQFTTNFHLNIKLFSSKKDAEYYYYKKLRKFSQSDCMTGFKVTRLKCALDKKGYLDYWKTRETFYRMRSYQ